MTRFLLMVLVLGLSACASVPPPADTPATPAPPPVKPVPPVAQPAKPPRIGLALGGGAARGFAHVGVIQVLEREGLRPDYVVGTSAGSLVAVLYASGMKPAELERAALSMEEAAIADWTLPLLSRGMLRGQALARYVSQQVGGKQLQELPLPVGVVATDLQSGEGIVFRRGDAGTAVRASSAVPGVFQPVAISGREYVDGGLVAPVPVRQARQMGAELVIAVDISSAPEGNPTGDTLQLLLQTFAIMGQSINRHELATADLVVRPSLVGVGSAAFAERQRAMAAGRAAMEAALPRLKALLAR